MKKRLYITGILILVLDQISKLWIIDHFPVETTKTIIPSFFSITHLKNTGASFSILTGNVLLLAITGIIIFVVGICYIQKNPPKSRFESICFGGILGGLVGNLIDRIFRGGVIDFLDFMIGHYNFPVFNIADIAIVLGIFGAIIIEIRGDNRGDKSRSRKDSLRSVRK